MWTKHSFHHFKRYIDYFHHKDAVFKQIELLPPIVDYRKIDCLKEQLKDCQNKKRIAIHSGDCAEPFQHVHKDILQHKIDFFRGLKLSIEQKHGRPCTVIGRIAGQYAKPRSNEFTTHNGKKIHNYKGDNVNSLHHDQRQPKQSKVLEGYYNSTVTHNFISNTLPQLFVSHEGLILPYQSALTRQINQKHYCLSAHMIWIGERTRQLDGAHVQFFRGISNPIGVKVSSKILDEEFMTLVKTLNPLNQQGKLLVIIRMGAGNIQQKLKHLIQIKQKHGLNFLFMSDPMHGNTYETKKDKIKVRHYDHILSQINTFRKFMHTSHLPFGLSLQTTHQDVTQCLGGAHPHHQHDLKPEKYTSKCDPRLNPLQVRQLVSDIVFQ